MAAASDWQPVFAAFLDLPYLVVAAYCSYLVDVVCHPYLVAAASSYP